MKRYLTKKYVNEIHDDFKFPKLEIYLSFFSDWFRWHGNSYRVILRREVCRPPPLFVYINIFV